jgi:uncharacterized membrane protein
MVRHTRSAQNLITVFSLFGGLVMPIYKFVGFLLAFINKRILLGKIVKASYFASKYEV